jgi:hypothetical protein
VRTFRIILLASILLTGIFVYQFATTPLLEEATVTIERIMPLSEGSEEREVEPERAEEPSSTSAPRILGVFTFAELIELIKALTPLLAPIIAFRYRKDMDNNMRKLGVGNRRARDVQVPNDRRKPR